MKLTKRSSGDALVGGLARVNLMPPEIAASKRAKRTSKSMLALVASTAILCVAAYAGSTILAVQAEIALALEEQRTEELLAEQAEFSEVQSINDTLAAATQALVSASAPEVLWADYIRGIREQLPAGVTLSEIAATGMSATQSKPMPSLPLEPDSFATIVFEITAGDLNQHASILRQLEEYVAVASALVTPASAVEGGAYKSTYTLLIDSDALSNKFLPAVDPVQSEEPITEETVQP